MDKNGKCKYVPFENYNGKDSFSFRASDRDSDGNLGVVTLEITPKNEAPQVMDATFALEEDGKLPIKLIASDPDGDSLTFRVVKQPANGSITGSVLLTNTLQKLIITVPISSLLLQQMAN